MEIWNEIKDYSNYRVSNLGKVRNSKTNRILKTYINHGGYEHIELRNDNGRKKYSIHRLVLSSFTEYKEFMHVNHINYIKTDNRLENLEWVTIKENNDKRRERYYISKVQISDLFNSKNFNNSNDFYNEIMNFGA